VSAPAQDAGRDLDARVALEVMGWRREEFWPVSDVRSDQSKPCESWYDASGKPALYHRPPEYSTDIAAAWAVVEKLRAGGWLVSLCDCGPFGWRCALLSTSPEVGDTPSASGDTPALAICRAALAAPRAAGGVGEVGDA
jgi:hypothetical protein